MFLPGIANANAQAADLGADESREQVLLSTARTYPGCRASKDCWRRPREAEKVALRREHDARARISAGTDVEIALLRAQTETAQARAQIANRQGQIDTLLPLLEALTGEAIQPEAARVVELTPAGEESAQPWENAYSVKSAIASTNAAAEVGEAGTVPLVAERVGNRPRELQLERRIRGEALDLRPDRERQRSRV